MMAVTIITPDDPMRILLLHQNYPGQFLRLAPALVERGHEVTAMTVEGNPRPSTVPTVRYRMQSRKFDPQTFGLATTFAMRTHQGYAAARAASVLRSSRGYVPDVVFGHIGWGETLFLKEVWPEARHLLYAEFYYHPRGLDADFDPELQKSELDQRLTTTARQAPLLHAMHGADKWLAPTRWQASTFPPEFRDRIAVIHDGIDTDRIRPGEDGVVQIPGTKLRFRQRDEIVTFVNRNLEPYRGYHIFMRALPEVLAARPEAHAVIVGGDGVSYGQSPPPGKTWKDIFLDEVKDRLDMRRVHFVGQLPYATFIDLMRVSSVHAYLTYPFVLSWSMLEAMCAGAYVVGSRTPPVEEMIEHGVNGKLVDFFDVKAWSAALIEALAERQRFEPLRSAARQTIVDGYDYRRVCLPRMVEFVEKP
jgi:glycosyltransferase involved in cell wall biosynthesis